MLFLDCTYDLAHIMIDELNFYHTPINCIANYEEIKQIATSIILLGEGQTDIVSAELYDDIDDNEFILTLDEFGIWIVSLANADKGILLYDEIVYVNDRCNSKILKQLSSCEVTLFTFDEYEDGDEFTCDGDCENCNFAEEDSEYKDSDEDLNGFTISKSTDNGYVSYSFYGTNNDMVKEVKDFINKLV